MFLLFLLILAFATMMDGDGASRESKETMTDRQTVGAAGFGCCIVFGIGVLLFGILASILN